MEVFWWELENRVKIYYSKRGVIEQEKTQKKTDLHRLSTAWIKILSRISLYSFL